MILLKDELAREYSDGYFVTTTGRVWSSKSSKWLKLFEPKGKNNYPEIKINGTITTKVHRMVAKLFLQPDVGCDCVNHIDGDKTNNNLSNLEWVTFADNMKHAGETGLLSKSKEWRDKIKASNIGSNVRISDEDIVEIFRLKKEELMTNIEIGKIMKVSKQYVSAVLNRKNRSDVIVPTQYICG